MAESTTSFVLRILSSVSLTIILMESVGLVNTSKHYRTKPQFECTTFNLFPRNHEYNKRDGSGVSSGVIQKNCGDFQRNKLQNIIRSQQ